MVGSLAAALLGAGCQLDSSEGILMAAGSYGDLAVVVSQDNLEPAVQPFIERLNRPVSFVIKEEAPYNVDVFRPGKWELCKNYKNILYVVQMGAGGPVEREIRRRLTDATLAQLRGGGLARLDDPYARYQYALVAVAGDRNALASLLNRRLERIREGLEEASRDRIVRRFRHEGIDEAMLAGTWRRHEFLLEMPRVYQRNQERQGDWQAVEWIRKTPSRGITVAWRPAADPDAALADREALLAWRRELGATLHQEDLVDLSLAWSDTVAAGLPAHKLVGAWTGRDFAGGGPFWSIFLPDREGGRVFCLDLLCYAPEEDKLPFFREMQAIVSTFALQPPAP